MAQGDPDAIKLNLGCGHKKMEGFINVDLANNWSHVKPDIAADISEKLPFENHYADEVHAYHVLEHFYHWQVPAILKEWMRVLKPGGLMVIEVPCFDKVMNYIIQCVREGKALDPRMSYWALYGDPSYKDESMCHHWCYGTLELKDIFTDAGLIDVRIKAPETHIWQRDTRIEGRKP